MGDVEETYIGVTFSQFYVGEFSGVSFTGNFESIFDAGSFTGDYQSDYETEEVTETYAGTYEGDTLYGAGGELLGTPASIETYTLYVRID